VATNVRAYSKLKISRRESFGVAGLRKSRERGVEPHVALAVDGFCQAKLHNMFAWRGLAVIFHDCTRPFLKSLKAAFAVLVVLALG
jgi:hypothetical protein